MSSRKLNDLNSDFKIIVFEFLARLTEAKIPIIIVETLRTHEEHLVNLAKGTSWTLYSKHIDGLAIDIAPYETYQLYGADKLQWDAEDPIWQEIGKIGKSLNLVWGGDWDQKDMGHFEASSLMKKV
jgi:hypothetical protein